MWGEDPPSIIDGDEHGTHEVITKDGADYVSDTRTTLSGGGKVLTIAEQYREPGLERIRDWLFEKQ